MKILLYIILLTGLLKAPTFSPPTCDAGSPGTVQLPATTTTLTGTASGTGGATITSTAWTVLINPTGASASITSPSSLTTGITGMTTWGNYVFRLIATDNNGLKDTATVRVNVLPICNVAAPVTYLLHPNTGGVSLDLDAHSQPWKGGDTVRFDTGWWPFITIYNFTGDACRDIFVDMTGVRTKVFSFNTHSQYIHFYNLEVDTGNTQAAVTGQLFNHITLDRFKIKATSAGGAGFFLKTTADISKPETIYPNYEMNGLTINDCNIDSTVSEAFYIGPSDPNVTDAGQPPYPAPRMRNVKIYRDTITNAGWDAIQVSGALDGTEIHDNLIRNYGRLNVSSQQAGIIIGATTTGDVYNNRILKGTGNAIEAFNYGVTKIYGNIIDSAGRDGTTNGQEAILLQDIISNYETLAVQKDSIYGNNITNARPNRAAIHSYNDNGTALAIVAHDNIICVPSGVNGGGLAFYITGSPTPVTANNTLSTTCVTVAANAGTDQTITLPTNSVTLSGAGSVGATTYAWSKISGTGGTITSLSSSSTTVTGLTAGVYVFRLTLNAGLSTDDIIVTVNPLINVSTKVPFQRRHRIVSHP